MVRTFLFSGNPKRAATQRSGCIASAWVIGLVLGLPRVGHDGALPGAGAGAGRRRHSGKNANKKRHTRSEIQLREENEKKKTGKKREK